MTKTWRRTKTGVGFARVAGRSDSSTSRFPYSLQLRVYPSKGVPANSTSENGMVLTARARHLSNERYNWWHSLRNVQPIAVYRLCEKHRVHFAVGLDLGARHFLRIPWSALNHRR